MSHNPKIKPEFRIADDFLDVKNRQSKDKRFLSTLGNPLDFRCLRTANTNAVIQQLEENMKVREMPLEKQLQRKGLLRRQ